MAETDQPDDTPGDLSHTVEFGRVGGPPLAHTRPRVEEAGAPQHRHHQRQRHFGDRLAVGTGHVAHRDAVLPRLVERDRIDADAELLDQLELRSEAHTSELQSLMRISYAVFCLKKKKLPS